ncbi:MAG: TetR/AcrR family transcriptional regulator, partial [Oscillospiraceae bacterium]|nr:TetR/AcrR family transcriptional regulator [Oscillospiraceae bacterium]
MQVLKEEIRNDILFSAKMLFGEYGYSSTSMDKIAKKAGVSKSNLYNYFEKKEDIFEALTKDTVYRLMVIKN